MSPRILVLSTLATFLVACAPQPEAGFNTISRAELEERKVEESGGPDQWNDESPANMECWGVRGEVRLPDGGASPAGAGDATVYLVRADELGASGLPAPGAELLDASEGPAELPAAYQLCFPEEVAGEDVAIVAVLDADGDGLICDDGDFLGVEFLTVDPEHSAGLDVEFTETMWAEDCERDEELLD